jgi:LmbE family N-acetylglucosaminyl deacetylase
VRELRLFESAGARATLLFLGAHPDDIEIGCGGTILALREARPELEIRFLVLSATPEREREARRSAERFLGEGGADRVAVERFRDGFLPYHGAAVKEVFERLKGEIRPDLVFTHCRNDLHQDHRLVSELTWNTWRDHAILEYEIPKYDGDLGQPNAFVPLRAEQVEAKVKLLLESFPSQLHRPWFDADTLRALPRLRGVECNAPGRFAEAFYARKLVVGLAP